MKIYKNIKQLLTLAPALKKDGRHLKPEDMGIINDAAIKFKKDEILWVGKSTELTTEEDRSAIDCSKYVVTPEIVDSHTHLVFAGDRSDEYLERLNGVDYQKIAERGGGIQFTVSQTRDASFEELYELGLERARQIHSYGVGTIECKSGYGLNYDSEKKLTLVIDKLKKELASEIQIINTFLAPHAVPKDFKTGRDYLVKAVFPLMEELKDKIDFVDIFHEVGYFDQADCELYYQKAKELGLKVRVHADEFNDNDGVRLALENDAYSVDHLLKTSTAAIEALAQSKCVATLLPGTALFLGKQLADARQFLDAGCKVALASDYNPGSCHCDNLLWLTAVAAPHLKLNACEMWSAITLNAAHSLALQDQGALAPKLKPRFSFFEVQNIGAITYSWGRNYRVATP